jgi:hypothetical protein
MPPIVQRHFEKYGRGSAPFLEGLQKMPSGTAAIIWRCMHALQWLGERGLLNEREIFHYIVAVGPHSVREPPEAIWRQLHDLIFQQVSAELHDYLKPGLRASPVQLALRRYDCLQAICRQLVDVDGSLNPATLSALRQALDHPQAREVLEEETHAHVLNRLEQLEAQPELGSHIGKIARITEVHESMRGFVQQSPGDSLPRTLGLAALGGLLDKVRQRNTNNCWMAALRCQSHESSPEEVLEAFDMMLRTGTVEKVEYDGTVIDAKAAIVPLDDPCAWKLKLRAPVTPEFLRERCPGCLVLRELLKLESEEQLAERFSAALGNRSHPLGRIVEEVVQQHFGLAHASSLQRDERQAEVIAVLDQVRNATAARENSLLLAAWATTVPPSSQVGLTMNVASAVINELDPDRTLRKALWQAFLADLRHVPDPKCADVDRYMILSLRARSPDKPRIDAIGIQGFRALLIELLDRAVETLVPRPDSTGISELQARIQSQDFIERVTSRYGALRNRAEDAPWALNGATHFETQFFSHGREAQRVGSIPSGKTFSVSVQLREAGWVFQGNQHPDGKKSVARATLENWMAFLRILSRDGYPLNESITGSKLIAADSEHVYRLMPLHPSWNDAWRESNASPAAWIKQKMIDPGRAQARQSYPSNQATDFLKSLLAHIKLNEGLTADEVVRLVLLRCPSKKRRIPTRPGRQGARPRAAWPGFQAEEPAFAARKFKKASIRSIADAAR